MDDTAPHLKLTHEGALRILRAAVDRAADMKVPQCIAIVDEGGNLLAFVRMDGAKFLSITTSQRKAMTAASSRTPTGGRDRDHAVELALVTEGRLTNLKAGLPIVVRGQVVGGIGVSSGSGDQDLDVARAGIAALEGAEDPQDRS